MKSRIGTKWTNEEVETLKKLIARGIRPSEIANEMGRCDKGVKSKAYSLKLKFESK